MSEKEKGKGKKGIIVYFYLVLILFTLWVSASYTWFSISRTPRVSDMQLNIGSTTGMELAFYWDSPDEEWTQHLNLGEIIDEMAPLKPATWVDSEQKFYAAEFGVDGRITGFTKELSDEKNANQNNSEGYYMVTSFYARTGTNVSVSLTPAITNFDGTEGSGTYVIGTPKWDENSIIHNNGGNGAEYTVRVGFRITKLDENGNNKADNVQFYVYEPNYDGHVDGTTGGQNTHSIRGDESLVPEGRLIRQTTSTWSEIYPVQKNVIVRELGEFVSDTHLFKLEAKEYAKIDLYIWMEGQDVDCNYMIGTDAEILANIQFLAEDEGQSGIEEFR